MRNEPSTLTAFLRGAAIGAAAMYMLDPDKGRRRRALARDKARRFAGDASDVLNAAAKDINNRMRGAKAEAARHLRREGTPDDLQLIERVRAQLGRAVSNPHAIQVGAREGRVVLSGPVLASEVDELIDAVSSVPGVTGVDDHLAVHPRAGSIPSLQGSGRRERSRPPALADNGRLLLRAATIVGGSLLAVYGVTQRSLAGLALAGLGGTLASRAATPATATANASPPQKAPAAPTERTSAQRETLVAEGTQGA